MGWLDRGRSRDDGNGDRHSRRDSARDEGNGRWPSPGPGGSVDRDPEAPELAAMLADARRLDPGAVAAWEHEMVAQVATAYVRVLSDGEEPDGSPRLGMVRAADGALLVPVFTSREALQAAVPAGIGYVVMGGGALLGLLARMEEPCGLSIEHGHPWCATLSADWVQRAIGVVASQDSHMTTLEEDTPVMVGVPAEPLASTDRTPIIDRLSMHPEVTAAWEMMWFIHGQHDQPVILLAVELSPDAGADQRRSALDDVWTAVCGVARSVDRQIDMIDVDTQRQILSETMADNDPIYRAGAADEGLWRAA